MPSTFDKQSCVCVCVCDGNYRENISYYVVNMTAGFLTLYHHELERQATWMVVGIWLTGDRSEMKQRLANITGAIIGKGVVVVKCCIDLQRHLDIQFPHDGRDTRSSIFQKDESPRNFKGGRFQGKNSL